MQTTLNRLSIIRLILLSGIFIPCLLLASCADFQERLRNATTHNRSTKSEPATTDPDAPILRGRWIRKDKDKKGKWVSTTIFRRVCEGYIIAEDKSYKVGLSSSYGEFSVALPPNVSSIELKCKVQGLARNTLRDTVVTVHKLNLAGKKKTVYLLPPLYFVFSDYSATHITRIEKAEAEVNAELGERARRDLPGHTVVNLNPAVEEPEK